MRHHLSGLLEQNRREEKNRGLEGHGSKQKTAKYRAEESGAEKLGGVLERRTSIRTDTCFVEEGVVTIA